MFVLCVGFTIAAIVNVFGDNAVVEHMAKSAACEAAQAKPAKPAAKPPAPAKSDECNMAMTRMSRTPFGQSFEYTGMNSTRQISCRRSLIFVGSYSCAVE